MAEKVVILYIIDIRLKTYNKTPYNLITFIMKNEIIMKMIKESSLIKTLLKTIIYSSVIGILILGIISVGFENYLTSRALTGETNSIMEAILNYIRI